MKLAYQKPAYKHILLSETTTAANNCTITNNSGWMECPIEWGPVDTVFTTKISCTFTNSEDNPIVCAYTGAPNRNVFGS